MALFEITDLTFSYPDAARPALQHIDLAIELGTFTAVCGTSGCGKTTLLRHLKTTLTPHGTRQGSVRFAGRELEEVDEREQTRAIGFVLQSPEAQIVTDTVWHELSFGLENLGESQQAMRIRVAEMASYLGIEAWFHRRVDELSGGQKQLLNLAAVLAMQPRVLVLDEPTAQLDPLAARTFLDTVRRVNMDLGVTVVMSEHRLEDVLPLADRVLVLDEGRTLIYDEPRAVGRALVEHEFFRAMPSPLRIQAASGLAGASPLTVREGRAWLDAQVAAPVGSAGVTGDEAQAAGAMGERHAVDTPTSEVVLSCTDAWFRYERREPDVLRALSLNVHRGELFCLLGGNGAGKTTALSMLAGLLQPYRGSVSVFGKRLHPRERATRSGAIGMLPQDPQCLFVEDTVRADALDVLSDRTDLTPEERERRLAQVAEQVEIAHVLDRHPYDLSGGEQQRAALAKVLLLEPKILLLDEPTKGLDALHKDRLADLLAHLRAQGMTVLVASHDIEFCAEHATRCALLFDGEVTAEADAHAFFGGNGFYTTAANRMARHLFPQAITVEEVVAACASVRPAQ